MIRTRLCFPMFALLLAPIGAQQTAAVADVLVEARVPSVDDADRLATLLLDAARDNARSPLAELLLQNAAGVLDEVDDPKPHIAALRSLLAGEVHGFARQEAMRTLRGLLREFGASGDGADLDPFAGYATKLACIGPFGDDGDHFLDAVYAPDLGFPAPGTVLRGRYGEVSPYVVTRRPDRREIELVRPGDDRSGCFFASHCIESDRAIAAWIEVESGSAWRLWLDGVVVADRLRPTLRVPRRTLVPVRLRAGVNRVVVKTGLEDQNTVGLRYVDARGATLAGVKELDPMGTAALGGPVPDDIPSPPVFTDGVEVLLREARDKDGRLVPAIAAAAALESLRVGDIDRGTDLLFAFDPEGPDDPRLALAIGEAWRSCPDMPRDLRDGLIHRIVDRAAKAAPRHWFAQAARADLLRGEDRLEDAARLLAGLLRDAHAGRSTFARLVAVQRSLGDAGGAERTCEDWLRTHPLDEDARGAIVRLHLERGSLTTAMRLLQDGLTLAPGQPALLHQTLSLATELGRAEVARNALARLHADDPDSFAARRDAADLARQLGDLDGARELESALAVDPRADRKTLTGLASLALRDGDDARARTLLGRVCTLRPAASIEEQRTLARLSGAVDDFPRIARFLAAADEIERMVKAFAPGARDAGAPATVLVDRMVVEMLPDGGRIEVVQQLRRINDLQGVQANEEATQAANADEVLRLRTLTGDGQSFVPSKVKGEYAMPRLEPGVFVEELWRRHVDAPDGGPWHGPSFLFQSEDEPFEHSELVLILPPGARGELRGRGIDAPPERITLDDGRVALRIVREAVPRLPQERATPPVGDLVPMVAWGEDDSFAAQVRLITIAAPIRARVTAPIRAATARVTAGCEGDLARARAIHAFVNDKIGVEANADATATLLRGQGSRFFLEAAMLDSAGVPLQHAAVRAEADELSSTETSLFLCDNAPQVPAVEVLPRDGAPLWLFADTPRHAPLGFVPATRAGAMLLRAGSGDLDRLPRGEARAPGWTARGVFTLDADGNGELDVELTLRDARGLQFAQQVRELERSRRGLIARNIGAQLFRGWTLRDAEIPDVAPGETFRVNLRMLRRGALEPSGDQRALALPFPSAEMFKRLGDQGPRLLPMRIDGLSLDDWSVLVRPGSHWRIASIPQSFVAEGAAADFSLRYTIEDDGVRIDRRHTVRPATIPAAQFDEWVHFLRTADRAEDGRLGVAAR